MATVLEVLRLAVVVGFAAMTSALVLYSRLRRRHGEPWPDAVRGYSLRYSDPERKAALERLG